MFDNHEILQIRIPREANADSWDLSKSVQLIISRDTGMVYGYGRKVGRVKSFFKDVWSEMRTHQAAERGFGTTPILACPFLNSISGPLRLRKSRPNKLPELKCGMEWQTIPNSMLSIRLDAYGETFPGRAELARP